MVRFFDSSFVLTQLLGQASEPKIQELWPGASRRLASSLLRFECIIGLRRAARLFNAPAEDSWVHVRVAALDRIFASIDFMEVDRSIETIVRETPALAECRTLDAIHLATALRFRMAEEGTLEIVTLDRKMGNVAQKLGLAVRPHS